MLSFGSAIVSMKSLVSNYVLGNGQELFGYDTSIKFELHEFVDISLLFSRKTIISHDSTEYTIVQIVNCSRICVFVVCLFSSCKESISEGLEITCPLLHRKGA